MSKKHYRRAESDERLLRELGKRIVARRRELHVTADVLALDIGVARSSVCKWESGETSMQVHQLALIADRLTADPAWLLTGKGMP